ncbi:low temperature requirement protein LtrA [Saccharopolyspora lacisalsi]|uniref:Low temperature requirement protein LtrA n=1 Tax=Halosaccharopolyspora lacisalsi TaxID=1000566 RepID=A0A839DUM8_9PSEU|nr:low temperature requirement protein A [Halosaccharopolyspora lacisalsi]MBA8824753.1 low temperature requirement protein LtrA [Halosaccharopolyspora lacisalsi]
MSENPDTQEPTRPRLLRPEGARRSEVAPIELFFDLVYVFAIVQVSHTLLAHLSWLGVAQVAVLFGAVWWAWNYSAWAMNWLDPHSGLVRVLNGLLMIAALGMSLGLPHAFDADGLLFAACYVAAQVGRPAFMAVAMRGHVLAKNYTNLLAWSASAGVLFIVGAFLAPGPRLIVWLVALFVDVAAPRLQFRFPGLGSAPMHTWPTDPGHLAERNRGVFIIALGESILIMGFTLSELDPIPARAIVAALLGFAGLFVLWWAYFALAGPDTQASQGEAHTGVLRSAFAYAHALMVAGAIVVAVSIELRITHAEADPAVVLTTMGGPLIYLAGNILFLRSRTGTVARARYLAAAALVVVGAVGLILGTVLPSLAIGIATVAVMGTLAVVTQIRATTAHRV